MSLKDKFKKQFEEAFSTERAGELDSNAEIVETDIIESVDT